MSVDIQGVRPPRASEAYFEVTFTLGSRTPSVWQRTRATVSDHENGRSRFGGYSPALA
jgi:hypothetical protein